jgi:hypothetical protein
MEIVNTIVFLAAIVWVVAVLLSTRHQLRNTGIVSLPMFASTLLFALGLIVMLGLGAAPLHLLWWFPLSAILGVLLMVSPDTFQHGLFKLAGWTTVGLRPRQDSSDKP